MLNWAAKLVQNKWRMRHSKTLTSLIRQAHAKKKATRIARIEKFMDKTKSRNARTGRVLVKLRLCQPWELPKNLPETPFFSQGIRVRYDFLRRHAMRQEEIRHVYKERCKHYLSLSYTLISLSLSIYLYIIDTHTYTLIRTHLSLSLTHTCIILSLSLSL